MSDKTDKNRIRFLVMCFYLAMILLQNSRAEGILNLPISLEVISQLSFYNNLSINKVILPDGINKIESLAFAYSSLTEINLPVSLTEIADDAFEGCTSLKKVIAEEGSYAYEWGRENGYFPRHKALLIGEKTFLRSYTILDGEKETTFYKLEYANRNAGDVQNLATMLSRVSGAKDGDDFSITKKVDLNLDEIRDAIITTFADSAVQDVSLLFIATHGLSAGDGDLEMAFTGNVDSLDDIVYHNLNNHLDFQTLAQWISQYINGEVIIILESCGSGSAIYSTEIEQNSTYKKGKKQSYEPKQFTEDAIKAFSEVDNGLPFKEGENTIKSTGDFRVPRFHVLAAARHHEESWGENDSVQNPQNYFTKWLIEGVGRKGMSPADMDENNQISQDEIYKYIKGIGDNHPFIYLGETYYQHVQSYPLNSEYILFRLK